MSVPYRSFGPSVLVVLSLVTAAPADGAAIDARTLRVSATLGGLPSGASADPVLSTTGRVIAFSTTSSTVVPSDVNGAVADVVLIDGVSGERRLVSVGLDGAAADGPSGEPAISRDGRRVAFSSDASNLVPGDVNGRTDVFVRDGIGQVSLVSSAAGGSSPGNRASRNPDISADGRYVVFQSDASDLVGNDSNGQTDIYVRDLLTGTIERVSVSTDGDQGTLPSSSPAISADGRVVSFESSATQLVEGDTNRKADVFVRDLVRARTERVSISSAGRQQNRAVAAPFRMVSDLDATGRRVTFDSEASNLVSTDSNRRSDVFVHDRKSKSTRLVSASTTNVQGNNDSVSPVITPSGRHVAFQSFATNLAADGDGTGADIFVRDLELLTTSIASVAADGSPRQPELVGQLLQRPSLSNNGQLAAFVSTATNLSADDTDAFADVFVRIMTPATTSTVRRSRRSVQVAADDAVARRFVCRVDVRVPYFCGPTVSLRRPGRSVTVRALGPGLLADPVGRTFRLTLDRVKPRARITSLPANRVTRTIRGRASDRGGSGIARIEIAVTYANRVGRCFFLDGTRFRPTFDCRVRAFRNVASGRQSWRFRIPRKLPPALISVAARAVDGSGNVSPVSTKIGILF